MSRTGTAVDGLPVTVQPGIVTGFTGPNGAGKSTAMRVIIGLDAPSAGEVRAGGRRYRDSRRRNDPSLLTAQARPLHL